MRLIVLLIKCQWLIWTFNLIQGWLPKRDGVWESSRQGCESWGVKVPLPSVAKNGRLAYPMHGEVTDRKKKGGEVSFVFLKIVFPVAKVCHVYHLKRTKWVGTKGNKQTKGVKSCKITLFYQDAGFFAFTFFYFIGFVDVFSERSA